MSRPRVAVSFVTMAVALMVGGRLVVSAFPLQGTTPAPATRDYDTLLKNYQSLLVQQEDSKVAADLSASAAAASRQTQTAKPQGSLRPGEPVPQPAVPPAAGAGLTKINDVPPVYPPEAAAAGISGPVVLTLTIDAGGRVTDAAVVKGDAMLAPAALEAVRQWRYRPIATAPVVATVAVNVVDSQQVAETVAGVRVGGDVKAPTKVKNVLPIYPAAARSERIQGVVITEARIGPSGIVTEARILRSIPLLDAAALDALMRWEFSPTLLNGVPVPVIMTVTTNFVLDSKPKTEAVEGGVAGGARGGVPGGVVGGAGETTPPQGAVRVGGDIAAPRKTVNVLPVYPEEAKAAGVQGVVIVEAVVGKDGKVESAKILRSIPMLDQAALEAVRQWEFTPTLVHGAPVDVIMTMTVNFKLE